MKISVIIPAYNSEKYIVKTLGTVFNQSYRPYEIILIDDGSIDETCNLVSKEFPEVIIIKQQNSGPAVARNVGIRMAKGDWITFLDSDDEWDDGFLLRMVNLLSIQRDLVWACSAYKINYPNRKEQIIKYSGQFLHNDRIICLLDAYGDFDKSNYAELVSTCSVIINKKYFEAELFFKEEYTNGEDIDLWFRLALKNPTIGYIKEVGFTYYRVNVNSITKTRSKNFNEQNNNISRINDSWMNVKIQNEDVRKSASNALNIWIYRELKSMIKHRKYKLIFDLNIDDMHFYINTKNHLLIWVVKFLGIVRK